MSENDISRQSQYIYLSYQSLDAIRKLTAAMTDSVKTIASAMEGIYQVVGEISLKLSVFGDAMAAQFKTMFKTMNDEAFHLFASVRAVPMYLRSTLKPINSMTADAIKDAIEPIIKDENLPAPPALSQSPIGQMQKEWENIFNNVDLLAKKIGSKGLIGDILKTAKSLGPQMMMFQLVTAPATAMLSGFLEVFEPITDIFGAFGEALSMAFAPLVADLSDRLVQFVPVVLNAANAVAPIITYFGKLANWGFILVTELLKPILPIISDVFDALTPLLTVFFSIIDPFKWLKAVLDGIRGPLQSVSNWIGKLKEGFNELLEVIKEIFGWVSDTVGAGAETIAGWFD